MSRQPIHQKGPWADWALSRAGARVERPSSLSGRTCLACYRGEAPEKHQALVFDTTFGLRTVWRCLVCSAGSWFSPQQVQVKGSQLEGNVKTRA